MNLQIHQEAFQGALFQLPFVQQTVPISVHSQELPSVARSETAAPNGSKRYGHIRTHAIVQQLCEVGFNVERSQTQGGQFGKHAIFLTHPKVQVEGFGVSGRRNLEIGFSVENSHDGTSSYRAHLALRDLDTQDVIPCSSEWSTVKIRHNQHIAQAAASATLGLGDSAPRVVTNLENLENVTLDQAARYRFAMKALEIRWGKKLAPIEIQEVIQAMPERQNLYTIMRAVNAVLLNGGTKTVRGSKTRRVRQPIERLRVAREVWALAERIAGNPEHG